VAKSSVLFGELTKSEWEETRSKWEDMFGGSSEPEQRSPAEQPQPTESAEQPKIHRLALRSVEAEVIREVLRHEKVDLKAKANLRLEMSHPGYRGCSEENMREWLQGLKGAIRVYGRKRPLNGVDRKGNKDKKVDENKECVHIDKKQNVVGVEQQLKSESSSRVKRENKAYVLDKVFDENPVVCSGNEHGDPTQEEIFKDARILLDSIFRGRNLSLFACKKNHTTPSLCSTSSQLASLVDLTISL
jgi:hypothetical protein